LEKGRILLISYGQFERIILERIASDVKTEFQKPVDIAVNYTDLSQFYDPTRRQYDGNRILKFMNSESSKEVVKTIGLFQVDLFIPILSFIFGQAIFKGNKGVVSLYRLKNEQYGLPRNKDILFDRFSKVIIHELGHTYGLIHCHVPTCVMRPGTYVEDIDQKQHHLCLKCRKELGLSR
jgi:archaemetzincin